MVAAPAPMSNPPPKPAATAIPVLCFYKKDLSFWT